MTSIRFSGLRQNRILIRPHSMLLSIPLCYFSDAKVRRLIDSFCQRIWLQQESLSEDMLSCIFLDVCLQLRGVLYLDVVCQSAVEPAYTGIIIDSGLKYPVCSFPCDVLGGKRIFLQKEILCPDAEAQLDLLRGLPGHPEHVGALATMAAFELPIFIQGLDFADSRDFEDLVMQVFQVVGPNVDKVCGECEWLNQPVFYAVAICGLVSNQTGFLLVFDSVGECSDVGGVALF